MSWAFCLAGDAQIDLKRLEIWLQEAILDELEFLAANADDTALRADSYPFYATNEGESLVVDLFLAYRDESQVLLLLGIHLKE